MSYQEKVFVAFDGPNDQDAYQLLSEMQQSDGAKFNVTSARDLYARLDKDSDEAIKEKMYHLMDDAKACLLLVGKTTKSYRRFIKWQIERVLATSLPIIVINANNIRTVDYDRCPTMMKKNLGMHIALHSPIIEYALVNYPSSHKSHLEQELHTPLRYSQAVYEELGLYTSDL